MATFKANIALNMEFEVLVGTTKPLTNRTDTRFTVDWGDGFRTVYEGTGLLSNSGVIAIAEDFEGSTSRWELTGINLTVGQFRTLMRDGGVGIYVTDYFSGNDMVEGSTGDDTLVGYAGNDVVEGGRGDDTLDGDGNDRGREGNADIASYDSASGGVVVNLRTGVASGADGRDDLFNFEGILGSRFDDTLTGDFKDNILTGGRGEDTLRGAEGDDDLNGDGGDDALDGGDGDDALNGGANNDSIVGGAGDDEIDGGTGGDRMTGGAGADNYVVDSSQDRVIESIVSASTAERDTVTSFLSSYTLTANVENLVLDGSANDGTGNDGANDIDGNERANDLFGLGGRDTIDGGDGNDVIVGGLGKDTLVGGRGADRFDFNATAESGPGASNRDVVTFSRSQGDKIDLLTIDANENATGNQAFAFVSASNLGAAFTGVAGQLRFANGILSGDTDGDRQADFEIQISSAIRTDDVIL